MDHPSRQRSLEALGEYVRNDERFEDHAGEGLLARSRLPVVTKARTLSHRLG